MPEADGGAAGFRSLYSHGFVRVAAAVPRLHLADVPANAESVIALVEQADRDHAALVVLPELCLVGYSAQDLFHQEVLDDAVRAGIARIAEATRGCRPVVVVGAPLRVGHQIFNVAFVLHRGRILGAVPKSYLPNYREFYEKRHFSAARDAPVDTIRLLDQDVPFGTDLLFEASDLADFVLAVEICEDVWVPIPPSTYAAMSGATVLANPSASNVTIAKADYRRELCISQSARTFSAYVYAGAGEGESTTDLAWDGHAIVAENGAILTETARFAHNSEIVVADVDLGRLLADRVRTTSFVDCTTDHRARLAVRRVPFELGVPSEPVPLRREIPRHPFVPADPAVRDERCAEIYAIQRQGLGVRLRAAGIEKVVIGVSGGLDSAQALLVAAHTMDDLGLPRANVLAYTLPGFATTSGTLENAHRLMRGLGVSAEEIDIRPAATQMLADLDHLAARGEPAYDVTYENVQAGARMSLLFRLANRHGALVVGTGDLSELALGWCTYGVGDQMSHYGVNASVPKTLIKYLVEWVAGTEDVGAEAAAALVAILATEISPELVPGEGGGDGTGPHQRSEDVVGPYALQDFTLYHVLRFGYRPSKVAFLADHAWGAGARDAAASETGDPVYDLPTICRWLRVFLTRYFQNQYKRSALPDGPKIGSGGALSPRGDWRMPSDASAAVWLAELDALEAELGLRA
jgi:NAD+ synthase (glutamine-hydrolysing)